MTSYFRIGGALVILFAVFFAGREYGAFAARRMSQLRGYYSLMEYVESAVSKYLCYGADLWKNFSCDALEKCGFLSSIRHGKSPHQAYSNCMAELSLSTRQKDLLDEFFADFGQEYRDGEIRRVEEYRKKLGEMIEGEEDSLEKSVKTVRALLFGCGLSLVILVI